MIRGGVSALRLSLGKVPRLLPRFGSSTPAPASPTAAIAAPDIQGLRSTSSSYDLGFGRGGGGCDGGKGPWLIARRSIEILERIGHGAAGEVFRGALLVWEPEGSLRRGLQRSASVEAADAAAAAEFSGLPRVGSGRGHVVTDRNGRRGSLALLEVAVKQIFIDDAAAVGGGYGYHGGEGSRDTAVADLLAEVQREAKVMWEVEHPHVLKFFGVCVDPPYIQIVTDRMDGSLADLLHGASAFRASDGGRLSSRSARAAAGDDEEEDAAEDGVEGAEDHCHGELRWDMLLVLQIAAKIVRGMLCLHERGFVHRDLKPANILHRNHGSSIKIADFGISCQAASPDAQVTSNVGTPSYMPPELVLDNPRTDVEGGMDLTKLDVYAFGVVLWELVARRKPYAELRNCPTMFQMMNKIAKGLRPPLDDERDATAWAACPALRGLVARCWAQDPAERPSFAQIQVEMDELDVVEAPEVAKVVEVGSGEAGEGEGETAVQKEAVLVLQTQAQLVADSEGTEEASAVI